MEFRVRQFLQSRGADPSKGIRCLAPALKVISLRKLINMERVIIHLSDLHIGLNNEQGMSGGSPSDQARRIINAIIQTYSNDELKPVVVITGDIVDYGYHSDDKIPLYWDCALGLLDDLAKAGFTVLVVPGNHDYSDEFDVDHMTYVETLDPFDITNLKLILEEQASTRGSSPKMVSGSTFVPEAVSNFQAKLGKYMHRTYNEFWKNQGAAFDLTFFLVDAQDKNPQPPKASDADEFNFKQNPGAPNGLTIAATEALEIDTKFFLHDKFLRFAHGYIDPLTYATLIAGVASAVASKSLPVFCIHYWVNYGLPNVLISYQEAIAVAVLRVLYQVYFSGTPEVNPIGGPLVWTLAAPGLPRLNNTDYDPDSFQTGSLWNEMNTDPSEPVPRENILKLLDLCHLLLVGHRHIPNYLQDLREQFIWMRGSLQDEVNNVKYIKSTFKDEEDLRKHITDKFSYIMRYLLIPITIDQAVTFVMNTDLDKLVNDINARYHQHEGNQMLAYYHEAGSPVPDPDPNNQHWDGPRQWDGAKNGWGYRSWAELRINLQTGHVTCYKQKCP